MGPSSTLDLASRMSGPWVVSSPTGRSPGDHVCWPFRRYEDLVAGARAYLAEGLARDERVAYVSDNPPDELRHDLDGLADLEEHLKQGQLLLVPFDTLPATDPSVRPAAELPMLAAMTAEALGAGYRGLRMFANGSYARRIQRGGPSTALRASPGQVLPRAPVTMMCAYDRSLLGDVTVAELACVHRLAHGGLSPFHLSADPRADVALAGSVDTFSAAHLMAALGELESRHPENTGRSTFPP